MKEKKYTKIREMKQKRNRNTHISMENIIFQLSITYQIAFTFAKQKISIFNYIFFNSKAVSRRYSIFIWLLCLYVFSL